MNLVLHACDLIITRAGTNNIAECQFCKRPMIFIPQISASDNHQFANAKRAEEQGIAFIIKQNNLHTLAKKTIEIISTLLVLATMQLNLEKIFVPNEVEQIVNITETFIQNKK
jgi:UDP-N-acetylglucosamine--N-acetylmuramyl-(pentapeptide) pyrophosphoryl-undecaprenol N-acetylglucosamine transferase